MGIHEQLDWENENFKRLQLSEDDLSNKSFEDCNFIDCDFINCNWRNTSFINCEFKNCSLSNLNVHNCKLNEVLFVESKLVGLNFSSCKNYYFSLSWISAMCCFATFPDVTWRRLPLVEVLLKIVIF